MKTFAVVSALLLVPQLVSSASLTSFCLTYYGSSSTSPVPTSSYSATTTTTRTVKSTSTPVSTVTPPSATTTKTVTSTAKTTTTLSKVTGTYTSTTTFTSTTVVTSVSTTTVTNTAVSTTTDTSPATATPSPNFIDLQAELRPGGYTNFACPSPSQFIARRGVRDLFARDPDAEPQLLPRATSSAAPSYPTSVGCTTLYYATSTSTSVVTASTTSTKSLKQGTITSTSTATTTTTITKVPSTVKLTVVSTTTTSTSTAISVSTATTVTTTTTTAYQPASTVYPACQANNLVHCVSGYQVSNPHFVYNIFEISGATDAASCCIACSQSQGCGGSMWYVNSRTCYGAISDVCEANNSFASFQIQAGDYAPIVFSNSNCGRWGVRAPDS